MVGDVLDESAGKTAAVFGLDDRVLVTGADDLVGVDDVGEQGVNGRTADTGEVGADVHAFAEEGVADEAGFLQEGVAGVVIDGAVEHDEFFGGDEFLLVGVGLAEAADGRREDRLELFVLLVRERAVRGVGDVFDGDGVES